MKKRSKKTITRIIREGFGIFFIILGIAGVILPIIPGIIFLIIGCSLLGFSFIDVLKKWKEKIFD